MIYESTNTNLEIRIPDEQRKGYVNNLKKMYDFKFSGVLDKKTTQDDIFEKIGAKVIKKYFILILVLSKAITTQCFAMDKQEQVKLILCADQKFGKNVDLFQEY